MRCDALCCAVLCCAVLCAGTLLAPGRWRKAELAAEGAAERGLDLLDIMAASKA